MIKKLIDTISRNHFLKSVAVLMSGSIIAQIIPVVLSPVLSRLFNEQDFGIYAIFVATINIASQIVCLKYDMAITVSEKDKDAVSLLYGCVAISVAFSLILLFTFPFSKIISNFLGIKNNIWIYFIPFSVFLTGLYTALINFNIRLGKYKDISHGNIIKSLAMVMSQISFLLLGFGGLSLIIGQIIAYFCGNIRLIKNLLPYLKSEKTNVSEIKSSLLNNKSFPKYTMIGSIANSLVYNITSYGIAFFFTSSELGYYSLVNRVLAVPLLMISNSVGQVFLKEASENIKSGESVEIFHKVTKILFKISLPIFIILFVFANPIVKFTFGANWEKAGGYMQIMLPLFMVRFIVTPISTTAIVIGKQKYTMIWQFGLLICSFIPMICSVLFNIKIEVYLIILSASLSIAYVIFYLLCSKLIISKEGYVE